MPEAESVQPLPFGQWLVKTPAGFLKLRPRYDATRSVLDYELVHPVAPASCYGPVHVAATPTGCHLAITFVKPECLPLPDFEVDMLRTAASLHLLKLMLEQH